MIRRIDLRGPAAPDDYRAALPRADFDVEAATHVVRPICDAVRERGVEAITEFSQKFDGVDQSDIVVQQQAIEDALTALDPGVRAGLEESIRRLRATCRAELEQDVVTDLAPGATVTHRMVPVERVGLYVPGGKAAYPSSVLMNAVPAKVAGVRELIMASPNPNPLVLAAAALAGVDRVLGIGGAQAIAALAYGTKSIPRVDKIVGPGNAYVAEAKRQVFGEVGIDMVAGPSEILVIADGSASADWVAMDLFSQAEHDESAQAILLSPDEGYLGAVESAIRRLLPGMPRRKVIAASLKARGALILTRDLEDACAVANRIAPEHLELVVEDPEAWLPRLTRAGAVFLGRWSSEAIGDYCAGPNHVLPTAGTARFSSPLGVYDFQKRTSVIGVSQASATKLGRIAMILADSEGLTAHARAAEMRLK
jgi:histidinol dehydrogenase